MSERPFVRMAPLIEALTAAVVPHLDVDFILFGHSMGAIIAFELACGLRRAGAPSPRGLIVSGRRAPQLQEPSAIYRLPDAELREVLRTRYNMPRAQLDNDALMAFALPALRSDFELIETWRYCEEARLDAPLTAVAGRDDDTVTRSDLVAWGALTTQLFRTYQMPGHHHFLIDNRSEWLDVLAGLVRA